MIDPEISEIFPPYFLPERGESLIAWVWLGPTSGELQAEVHFGEQGRYLGAITLAPTPSGSRIVVSDGALSVIISESDKAALIGRSVMFGLWVEAGARQEERFGSVIVSDWAAAPHEGTA